MRNMDWIINGIKYVCETYRRRSAGSRSEYECQQYFAGELEHCADDVREEAFQMHPKAFLGSIHVQAFLGIAFTVLYWAAHILSSYLVSILCCIAGTLAFFTWLFEYMLYRRLIDWAFRKKTSHNIYAARRSEEDTKRRIIFVGHADATYEMPCLIKTKAWVIASAMLLAILGLSIAFIGGFLQLYIKGGSTLWMIIGIAECVFSIVYLPFMFFVDWNRTVDGANDNLTGCYIGLGVLREMEEQNVRFAHTEVCCLITGGEESGLRGSLNFAKKHKKMLKDTDTVVIAVDTIHEIEHLMVYNRGINGTQKNSARACALLRQAGKNCGVHLKNAGIYPGADDSGAFSRHGIDATALCGVRHTPAPYYHTRYDTCDNINPDCISLAMDICWEAAKLFDAEVY